MYAIVQISHVTACTTVLGVIATTLFKLAMQCFSGSAERPATSFRPNVKVGAATAHKQIRGSASSAAQPASDSTAAELPFAISTPCETQARRFSTLVICNRKSEIWILQSET